VIGDEREYIVALVTLKAKGATGESAGTDELEGPALDMSPGILTISAAVNDDGIIQIIQKAIEDTNNNGSCCPSNASKIQKFSILPCDFSVEGGEFTTTLKTRRAAVTSKYAPTIERMYNSNTNDCYIPYLSTNFGD